MKLLIYYDNLPIRIDQKELSLWYNRKLTRFL
jgi:hypothetical protein